MKLLGTNTSPYVRKVRIVLAEKKLDYRFVLEDIGTPEAKIREINPLGKVPCLVMDDGDAIYDSSVIVEYLDTLSPVGKLIPPAGRERAEVRRWEALADGVMDAAVLVRLEQTRRPAGQQSQQWVDLQMGKIEAGLKAMATDLGDKPFCNGNQYSLADIAVGCALGWLAFRFPQIDWRESYPNLAKLFDKIAARAPFKDTVPQA
ncbi:MAG: glutathione S-transferase N-terminal domain-containing protein [Burkholderiaceae bacterium]|nr:glutathione S-transferase N-terminal domain-containing protein [Burkholderiaceae bacterium]